MKRLFAILSAVLFTALLFAQSPEKMSYQAVIRNINGQLVTSKMVGMQISILQGSASGTVVYTETQTPTSNINGLVTIEIGVDAGFSTIDWSAGPYFIKTETDPAGGTDYTITGISQLLSVPYALHAKTAEIISETDPEYTTDSASIKTGIRSWNSSLARTISTVDTTRWGANQSLSISNDSVFLSNGGSIKLPQETDPLYTADSSFIKSGVRDWNKSLARTIDAADTSYWGRAETDPLYAADSSFIKSGVRDWNKSLARTIDAADTSYWGRAETDPLYAADSTFIKSGVRNWNSSSAKTITSTDITNWNNKSDFDGNYNSLSNAPDIAVSTTNKNITLSSGQTFSIKDASSTYMAVNQSTGLVGIGKVTSPRAQLEVGGTDGILCSGTVNSGTVRALGSGVRFHWYPRKGALRAGMAESSYWDDDGSSSPRLALYSCAIGYQPRATGVASYAFGAYNKSTGDYSLSLGSYNQASASHAIAIGTQVFASGIYSIALGCGADTDGKDGAMVVGDDTYFQTAYATADNQLTMRFSGGYRLWSSYPDSTSGVYMRHGQSGWSNYCDRNKKTNFEKVDYEAVLEKLGKVPVTKWNYKGIEGEKYIGPMAQDFYAAFQLNGTDSLGINSISEMGVSLAAIHGLIERTDKLKATLDELQGEKEKVAQLENLLLKQSALIDEMKKELTELKGEVSKYAAKSKESTNKPLADNANH